jgi:molecular chaperone DnaJ
VRAKRTVHVDVPAGVDTGMRLHLPGEGEAGPAGGENGDLYLEVKVKHHAIFSRNGDDLLATLEVQMTDAILGTVSTLPGLDGDVEVEIKAGTQSADIVTVKDRGITRLRGGGRGELRIGIQVVTPVRLNSKESQLIQQFAESRRPVPPEFSTFQQGLFAKLRDRFLGV